MPDDQRLAEHKGLPSKYLGSDHLALVSDFRWSKFKEQKHAATTIR